MTTCLPVSAVGGSVRQPSSVRTVSRREVTNGMAQRNSWMTLKIRMEGGAEV